ncbi:hypothetical protein [Piscirickettsia salmonis]|uniref:hypothetical protein n=1 Tax=Piscirickettsia salmonis TaxID=1238 RepID=UPI0012B9EE70|nr:hypothetical protein [Piscirickettsia salmonis]
MTRLKLSNSSILKERYGAMDISQLKRLKQLEKENQQLKRMYADSQIEIEALKDVVEKKLPI